MYFGSVLMINLALLPWLIVFDSLYFIYIDRLYKWDRGRLKKHTDIYSIYPYDNYVKNSIEPVTMFWEQIYRIADDE